MVFFHQLVSIMTNKDNINVHFHRTLRIERPQPNFIRLPIGTVQPHYLVLLVLSFAGRFEHLLIVTIKAVFSKLYFTLKAKIEIF